MKHRLFWPVAVRIQVSMAVPVMSAVFWDVATWSLVDVYRLFKHNQLPTLSRPQNLLKLCIFY